MINFMGGKQNSTELDAGKQKQTKKDFNQLM
jgi:hypothetical protein